MCMHTARMCKHAHVFTGLRGVERLVVRGSSINRPEGLAWEAQSGVFRVLSLGHSKARP